MSKNDSTAIVPFTQCQALEVARTGDLGAIVEDNFLDGEGLQFKDLRRFKISPGGVPVFQVITGEDEKSKQTVDGFEAVIIDRHFARGFWRKGMDEGGRSAPDCRSVDGKIGVGKNTWDGEESGEHECATCPMAQFGSARKGDGQACSLKQVLYLMPVGSEDLFPSVLQAPPTSVRAIRSFGAGLIRTGRMISRQVIRFSLATEKNASGTDYSRLALAVSRELNPEEHALFEEYRKGAAQMLTVFRQQAAEAVEDAPRGDASGPQPAAAPSQAATGGTAAPIGSEDDEPEFVTAEKGQQGTLDGMDEPAGTADPQGAR